MHPLTRRDSSSNATKQSNMSALGELGGLGAHLIDTAAQEIGDLFRPLARRQAVPQVLEIERRPGFAGVDVQGAGSRNSCSIANQDAALTGATVAHGR
jgi:hypothetical protein